MKKTYIVFLLFLLIMNITAKEMQLYNNDTGEKEFSELELEEQYLSYMNSFRYVKDPRSQPLYWARSMVKQYGREVLPLIDVDLEVCNFDHEYRKPYDSGMGLIAYILSALNRLELLTQKDKDYYQSIFLNKLEDYVLKFRIIDGTVRVAIKSTEFFSVLPEDFPYGSEPLKEYFEQKLGISGIVAGNLNSYWED